MEDIEPCLTITRLLVALKRFDSREVGEPVRALAQYFETRSSAGLWHDHDIKLMGLSTITTFPLMKGKLRDSLINYDPLPLHLNNAIHFSVFNSFSPS